MGGLQRYAEGIHGLFLNVEPLLITQIVQVFVVCGMGECLVNVLFVLSVHLIRNKAPSSP
jgi:hypothetical protein